MDWEAVLRIAVWGASAFSLTALCVLILRTARYGRPHLYSQAHGSPLSGVVYAFGKGMMPWEKESVYKHPLTFGAGIFYHLGIALAYLLLYSHLLVIQLPQALTLAIRIGLLAGTGFGLGLFVKRIVKPTLRQLSCPDDFLANLSVDVFLLLTYFYFVGTLSETIWLIAALLLLLYIPLGKIRHCFFFFYTRILFGIFFGRRGVYPGPKSRHLKNG